MKRPLLYAAPICLLAVCLPALNAAETWNPKAAATYLDQRSDWWMTWRSAARDHGTFCVSCHTAVPYALSRASLRTALGESAVSTPEQKLLDNVTKRVRLWSEVEPFYKDNPSGPTKSGESRGTEAVLNALILATASPAAITDDARSAFSNMWALQIASGEQRGAFPWLDFHNRPWEADDSQYYGSTLAAIAIGSAPKSYRADPAVQGKLDLLVSYLQHGYEAQSPVNRLAVLWASTKLPGLLTAAQRQAMIDECLRTQQADGGWNLASLSGTWKRRDNTPLETKSDGYATGMIAYVLEQAGLLPAQSPVKGGLAWLAQNQSKTDGLWRSYSMNKDRDLSSDVGLFMSDAATAYAVLALTSAK